MVVSNRHLWFFRPAHRPSLLTPHFGARSRNRTDTICLEDRNPTLERYALFVQKIYNLMVIKCLRLFKNKKIGADSWNRTNVRCLQDSHSSVELHQRFSGDRWDSNPYLTEPQSVTLPLSYNHLLTRLESNQRPPPCKNDTPP